MTQVESRIDGASIESIDDQIGSLTVDPMSSLHGPYKDDKNECWARGRTVLFRNVFELYPTHEAALACLEQYSELELYQPFLFLETVDLINERRDAPARRILAKHPELGLSEWAYQHFIESLSKRLFRSLGGDIEKNEEDGRRVDRWLSR